MPIKIAVTGIRGKSSLVQWLELMFRNRGYKTLAKITGENPYWIQNGKLKLIERKNNVVFLDETLKYRKIPFDVFIAENQGIREYTMRVFHDMVEPELIVVTNVRLDHTETLGRTKPEIAESIGKSFSKAKFVISGERDFELNSLLQKHALRIGATFIRLPEGVTIEKWNPLGDLILLLDTILGISGAGRLSTGEIDGLLEEIENRCSIRRNGSLAWFAGAKINDIDSANQMLDYFLQKYPEKIFSVVAFLRKDRQDRTENFLPWFKKIAQLSQVKQIILAGHGAEYVAKKIGAKAVVIKENTSPEKVIEGCRDTVLFTACNAVNPFMVNLKNWLETS